MFRRLTLAVLVLLLGATSLGAAEIYAGIGAAGKIEAGSFRQDLERYADADDTAWKVLIGTRIGDHLALEVASLDLGAQVCCTQIADLGYRSKVDGVSAAALGRWPFRRVVPFAKVGVLSWSEDGQFISLLGPSPESDDGTDLLFGAGIEMDLSEQFGVRAEWERYRFDDISTDGVWAALIARF